jgi:hypothetical protein
MTPQGENNMKVETSIETAKAAPAVIGAALSAVTMNHLVAAATLAYILLQAAYLIWKWRREAARDR